MIMTQEDFNASMERYKNRYKKVKIIILEEEK